MQNDRQAPGAHRASGADRAKPVDADPTARGRSFHAHLGQLVHRAVAACLVEGRRAGRQPVELRDVVVARVLREDPLRADRRRGLLLLRSMVGAYLRCYQRQGQWTLLDVERVTVSGRRTDLLFRHAETGTVVADELKTSSTSVGYMSEAESDQVSAYLADLRREYGGDFGGVRLVHLGPPAHASLFVTEADVRDARGARRGSAA